MTRHADFAAAWKVDFNQTVESFKPLLDGTRGLVDLCLTSPYEVAPKMLFTGSISVFKGAHLLTDGPHLSKLTIFLDCRVEHFGRRNRGAH